jgi:hypothetical protein
VLRDRFMTQRHRPAEPIAEHARACRDSQVMAGAILAAPSWSLAKC